MPSKYVVRKLQGNSYYHIFNRGIDGRIIFLDKNDYQAFLYYLYIYTSSIEEVKKRYPNIPKRLISKNLYGEIYFVSYCLMPNHFHLLIKQRSDKSMSKFIKQVINAYITYFNKKYQHVGTIFQGRYKAAKVQSELLVVQMARFIHLNPVIEGICLKPGDYLWSSYINSSLTTGIINRFANLEEWEKFHLNTEDFKNNLPKIANLVIEDI